MNSWLVNAGSVHSGTGTRHDLLLPQPGHSVCQKERKGIKRMLLLLNLITFINPNLHCLGIENAFSVKMKISPGQLKQNIFLKSKIPRKKS
jgi:hypothetical protein